MGITNRNSGASSFLSTSSLIIPAVLGYLRKIAYWTFLVPGFVLAPVSAQVESYLQRIQATAERQIASHPSLSGYQGSYTVSWESPQPALSAACALPLRVNVVEQAKLWGDIRVQLICPSPGRAGWVKQMRGYVAVEKEFWTLTRSVQAGEPFQQDLAVRIRGDLAQLPPDTLADLVGELDELERKEAKRAIRVGQPLVLNAWKKIAVINKGSYVNLLLEGAGFSVTSTGIALDGGGEGDTIRVRTPDGEVLEGVALEDGVVRVIVR